MTVKLILMLLLITNICVGDYSYEDYEEIPDSSFLNTEKTSSVIDGVNDVEEIFENDTHSETMNDQLDAMSKMFRKNMNKIKTKHKKIDMVFLVDSSSSVGKENFANEISFVKRLLTDFNVSFNYTRVALISFSSRSKIITYIDQISKASIENDKCVLLNQQIPNITYSGPGGTNTFLALLRAKEIFENSKRKNSKKILLLITDGFSNGRNPIPIAQDLKSAGVTVFTFSISSGNYDELRSLSSKPVINYNYVLSSFSLFESLARKALHTDYKVGEIIPLVNVTYCDSLCGRNFSEEACCVENSQCACITGHYSCICEPGYYGTGLRPNGCEICPNNSYWSSWNSCLNCPDINHETRVSPALSSDDCICKTGFRETLEKRCEVIKCPLLNVPDNGYFVHSTSCLNTVNTACGARCNSGYQLIGSSIRLCQEDGFWTGNKTECVLKTCPAFVIPYGLMALCKNSDLNMTIDYSPRNETFMKNYSTTVQKMTENFPIDSECDFSCTFGFYLVGSSKRQCLPLSKWDGLQASCKQILCQPLPKIPFGSYDSEGCSDQKSPYGTNCTLYCEDGFEIKGPSYKVCGGTRNGVWTQKNKLSRCIDVSSPNIVCPKNYSIELSDNKSYVLLSSFEPMVSVEDNSGGNVIFWVKPALKEGGTKMHLGNYLFTYVAIDDSKNKAKCNFSISIVDNTPPMFENCISKQTFYISSKNKTDQTIEWMEPFAYDSVDDRNITFISSPHHGLYDVGVHVVNYTAVDRSNNTNTCSIEIIVKEKICENLQKPENGQHVCAKNETTLWCDFRCNFGFSFAVNETLIENMIVYCDIEKGTWSSGAVPECLEVIAPSSAKEVMTISFLSEDLLCEEIAENQAQLIQDLKKDLCGEQECDITTELPKGCTTIEDPKGENVNSTFYSVVKREIATKPLKTTKSPGKVEIYIKISKNLHIWKNNSTKSENVKKVKEELKKVNTSEKLRKRLRKMNVDLVALKLDERITCNAGSVAKNLVCVQCSRGTFHEITRNICLPCHIGSFSDKAGQTKCNQCPEFYSTRKPGSRSAADCRQVCLPGTYARIKTTRKNNSTDLVKTLMPFCRSCSVGEFQSKHDQTSCEMCPDGKTSERGAKSIESCYEKHESSCDNFTCGENGKCISNEGFYICECQNEYYGEKCELSQDHCKITPCLNGGTCINNFNESLVRCECVPGYEGKFCEGFHDPCSIKSCLNGAFCKELFGNASCECLDGFEGDQCEKQIQVDFCARSPCENEAKCFNKINDYECVCTAGWIGKRCHLMPCDYKPCPKNANCLNLKHFNATKESYLCKCPKGLKGDQCDTVDNPCDSSPCRSNSECAATVLRDLKNISFAGDETIFEKFTCKCPPFFYGDRCELFTTPDFMFDFEKSSISHYVKFSGPSFKLNELSFCVWIQTNDRMNYGSIISYATKQFDNSFTFTDYNGFVLYVNGQNIVTDIKIIDNVWHFLCVSWTSDSGSYKIYLDGVLNTEGFNLSYSMPIEGNGIFVIGQEQDNVGGGFNEAESFIGKISYLDFWSREISAIEITEYYRTCDPYQGNLYSWTDMKFKTVGAINIRQSDFCKPCDKNLLIDNADVIYGDQTAFVKCHIGFKLNGNPFVFCLRTSKWELSKLPSCDLVKCSLLKTPLNGRLILTKVSYNSQAKFTCDDGFTLMGNDVVTCLSNGNWSHNVPFCKSNYECPALNGRKPLNGVLLYASDSGLISEQLKFYPVGTFAEIKCNKGYKYEGENLISCTEQGSWDFDVEDCMIDGTAEVKEESKEISFKEFLREFKAFLFYSCNTESSEKSKLCTRYTSDFDTDLTLFTLPENPDIERVDEKLSDFLKILLESSQLKLLNVGNFIQILMSNHTESFVRDTYRFALCIYIDLIIADADSVNDDSGANNINENIKSMLKKITLLLERSQ